MELIEHLNWKIEEKDKQLLQKDKTIEYLNQRVNELEALVGCIPGHYARVPIGYLCAGKNVVGADES